MSKQRLVYKKIYEFEKNIIALWNANFSHNYTDLFAAAAIDRALKNAKSLVCLLKARSASDAGNILRCMIDTLARFNGIFVAEGKECDFVYYFMDPAIRLNTFKYKEKIKFSDAYLVEQVAKEYPKIQPFYDVYCNCTHFSQHHLMSCSYPQKVGESVTFTINLSREDLYINEKTYSNILDGANYVHNAFLTILRKYFENKNSFVDNSSYRGPKHNKTPS